jgi:hypothetical protein
VRSAFAVPPSYRGSVARQVVSPGLLYGWEQIGAYLGMSGRTAQRLHARAAMPLVRWRGAVCSMRVALEQWFLSQPLRDPHRYAVVRPPCPHCGLRPTDPPRGVSTTDPNASGG